MGERRYRVLYVCTHPVQYAAPLFTRMAKHQALDIVVAYCSLQGADAALDPGFGVEVAWDVPLLEGYQWLRIPNRSPRPGLGRFLGLVNTGLWSLVRDGGFDAIVAFTGYKYASFWIVAAAAKVYGKALLFGTDAHEMASQDRSMWRLRAKRLIWPRLFRLADVVIVPSTGGVGLMRSLGIPAERVVLTPYVVENDWWRDEAARADRPAIRARWGVPEFATVIVFSGKLQPWKRPGDLLLSFAKARVDSAYLIYAGDGPLRTELEGLAGQLGVAERVRFLGFVNQSLLPGIYSASDLLVLPSEYEPFGVVVNEAMLCGCPVVVSDRVGAGADLVWPGDNGLIVRCGDIDALAAALNELLRDQDRLRRMGKQATERMAAWSPRENIEGQIRAIEQALLLRHHRAVTE
jgi:glycosyltransferase involved in cell wall biosynthesis